MLSQSVRQQKKLDKKGVDALFSRDVERGRTGLFIANLAILVGLALWTINIVGAQRPSYFGPSGLDSYTSLVLAPLGIVFVVAGASLYLSLRTPANLGSQPQSSPGPIPVSSMRLGIAAFFESVVIVSLYAGILDEYRSNLDMQDWVRRTLPTAQIFLSYEALILSSGILALLVVQFLPGRRFCQTVA